MTLDIAIANYWFVFHVSDRRLTLDGRPWDDKANKAVVFGCRDAMLAITYTGLAYIGDIPTDVWISETLVANDLQHRDMGFAVDSLRQAATKAFAEDIPAVDRGTEQTFLVAGWHWKGQRVRSYIWWITNRNVWVREKVINDRFEKGYFRGKRDARVGEGHGGCAAGARAAINPSIWRTFSRSIAGERDASKLVDGIVAVIRSSADHPQHGSFIGKECLSVVLPRPGNGDISCEYHATDSSPISFTPRIVTPNVYSPSLEMIGPGMTIQAGGRTYHLKGSDRSHPHVLFAFRAQRMRRRPAT